MKAPVATIKNAVLLLICLLLLPLGDAFAPARVDDLRTTPSSTQLYAVGALAKKAKEATLRDYIKGGVEDSVMKQIEIIKQAAAADKSSTTSSSMGPLQTEITKRKGTITVIAEYKRKLQGSGYVKDIFEPEVLSREFREFGASGIAVMADERMGGCTYADMQLFIEDQRRSQNDVPGPVLVINNDLIIDELQIAQSAAYGAAAAVITLDIVGEESATSLLQACQAVNIEAIVAVSNHEEAQQAVDLGARILSVINVDGPDEKEAVIQDLNIAEDAPVSFIANIVHRDDKGLQEVEEAWACRDKGFHCAWIADALYKAGNSDVEHPGAIIKSMKSKSSLRWASPVAKSGRGEGAREYLGDIMM